MQDGGHARGRATRAVALSVGFVGSRYHGYQADTSFPTIEQCMREACIALQIAPFTRKIKPQHRWTASSRTDARVHASRIVITAPLCVPPDCTEDKLTEDLNAQLPHDIRVHAACFLQPPLAPTEEDWTEGGTRATRGFDARAHCSHREYTYVMPLSAIAAIAPRSSVAAHEALARAQEVCAMFRGSQDFHNFCSPTRVPQLRSYARAEHESLPFSSRKVREGEAVQVLRLRADGEFETWPGRMVRGCRTDIYRCDATLRRGTAAGTYLRDLKAYSSAGSGYDVGECR